MARKFIKARERNILAVRKYRRKKMSQLKNTYQKIYEKRKELKSLNEKTKQLKMQNALLEQIIKKINSNEKVSSQELKMLSSIECLNEA